MKSSSRSPSPAARTTAVLVSLVALAPANAHAYIDPGTGSMLLQAVVAALVGLGLTLRQVRGWLGRLARRILGSREEI